MTLDVEHLVIEIDGRRVLDDVSFRVADGERLGLIGESGSGKSIATLAVMGLLPRGATATGSIRLDGRELLGMPDRELARLRGSELGMVFQDPATALNPVRRVGAQIGESLRIHRGLSKRDALAAAVRLAGQVALPEPERLVQRYPHQLSGGQRQRVAIAMALAAGPGLLIADEPTTALDVTVQAGVVALLRGLVAERGMSLLFITHDIGVLAQVVERAVVLAKGRVVETGGIDDIVHRPTHPVTASLVAAARATSWRGSADG